MAWSLPTFSEFDVDDSGAVSKEEFNEARGKRIETRAKQGHTMRNLTNAPPFAEIDQDGDGRLNPEEFDAVQAEHRGPTASPND